MPPISPCASAYQSPPRTATTLSAEKGPAPSIGEVDPPHNELRRVQNELMWAQFDLLRRLPLKMGANIYLQGILLWKKQSIFSVGSKEDLNREVQATLEPKDSIIYKIMQFLGADEIKRAPCGEAIGPYFSDPSPNESYIRRGPFRVLLDYTLEKRYESIPFAAMKLVLSTTNKSQHISIQQLIDIGLISLKQAECLNISASMAAGDRATSTHSDCFGHIHLSEAHWSFIRQNMAELLPSARKQPFNIDTFLKIPAEALEGGRAQAFLIEAHKEVVMLMLEAPELYKNILDFERHPIVGLLKDIRQENIAGIRRWVKEGIEKSIPAGEEIEGEVLYPAQGLFQLAIGSSYTNIVKLLIQSGVQLYQNKKTLLLLGYVVQSGDFARVQSLLEEGTEAQNLVSLLDIAIKEYAKTPQQNLLKIIEALLEQIEDIRNQKDSLGRTLLNYAIEDKWPLLLVRLLLDKKADPLPQGKPYWNSPLCKAVEQKGSLEIIKALIEQIKDINQEDDNGHTLLYYAIQSNWPLDMLELLLEKGADPFLKNKPSSDSPLCKAVKQKSSLEIIKALIERIKDINQEDGDGRTLLHRAVWQEWPIGAIEALLAQGADPLPKDQLYSDSILFKAAEKNNSQLRKIYYFDRIKALVDRIKEINQKDATGDWLMRLAIREKYDVETIKCLFDKGAHFSFSLKNLLALRSIKNRDPDGEVFAFLKTKASEGFFGFTWLRKAVIFCFCL